MSWNDLRKGRYSCCDYCYFITITVDGRQQIFKNDKLALIFKRYLEDLELQGEIQWLSWVIMPDHFHGLLKLHKGNLSHTIKLLKGRVARDLNIQRGRSGKVWQEGFYDHALRKHEAVQPIVDYIVYNPVRAKLVSTPNQWPWVYGL